MANYLLRDRVLDSTTTTGTGNITLDNSPPAGYVSLNTAFGTGTNFPYLIELGSEWELGLGTLSSSTVLVRSTVIKSSNADALVNFSAGIKIVYSPLPAHLPIIYDTLGRLPLSFTAISSGVTSYLTVTAPADTSLTASTEAIGVSFVGATRQHATGALTLQREVVFGAPTYSFAGASTLTTAVNVDIADPVQGTNATITNNYSLRAGNVLFTGIIKAGSTPTTLTNSAGKVLGASLVGTDIATLGTVTTGTWQGTVIDSTYGGTGVNNAGRTLTISTNSGTLAFGAASKTLTINKTMSFTAADDTGVYTFPTGTKTLVATDVTTLSALATIGTITSGTWQGSVISSTYGGTGVNNAGRTLTISTNSGTISFTSSVTLTVAATASVSGTNTGDQTITLTSDVTGSGTGSFATTIAAGVVTLAKLANLAANSVIGNSTGSSATPTAVSMVTTATASAILLRDSNANAIANNFLRNYTTTATAGGTTTLTVSSAYFQYFTGTSTQTVTLPVASTLANGQSWVIVNKSTGAVTIQTSGTNTLVILAAGTSATVTCINTAGGTGTASWDYTYQGHSVTSAKKLTLSNTMSFSAADDTGVYTFPTGTKTLVATDVTSLASLATVGTISSGTWQGTVIGSTYGGTGVNNAGRTLTISTNSGTIAFGVASKTLTINNTLSLSGTDAKSLTLTTSLTVSGNDGTLSFGAASKTLTVNNSLTLAGTDSTTMTFPSTTGTVATLAATQTFTNKTFIDATNVVEEITTTTSSATPTPTGGSLRNFFTVTALAVGATFASPSGTPVNGNYLTIRIKDNGTLRSLAWNAIYRAIGVTLPTTTAANKTIYVGARYNSADSKWDVIAVASEA